MRGRGSERGGYREEPEDEGGRRDGISPLPKPVCISGRTRKRGKGRESEREREREEEEEEEQKEREKGCEIGSRSLCSPEISVLRVRLTPESAAAAVRSRRRPCVTFPLLINASFRRARYDPDTTRCKNQMRRDDVAIHESSRTRNL